MLASAFVVPQVFRRVIHSGVVVLFVLGSLEMVCVFYGMLEATVHTHTGHALTGLLSAALSGMIRIFTVFVCEIGDILLKYYTPLTI